MYRLQPWPVGHKTKTMDGALKIEQTPPDSQNAKKEKRLVPENFP
jgi:hypothetical protein